MTGNELRRERLSLGLSQVKLAKRLGISRGSLRKHELLYEKPIPLVIMFAISGFKLCEMLKGNDGDKS